MTIDLASLGRELKKPIETIQSAIDLLDAGNTIPFVTRFRKDQTGGLNEEQLLLIKQSVTRLRAVAERRAFIRKSIETQGKLTDAISAALDSAQSSRQLEDIYLPFKPKKQTLATVARQNGLEPLANDIFEGREPEKALADRATDFVRVDKQRNTVDDVIAGVGHILAEKFSDNVDQRIKLRKLIRQHGKLVTQLVPLAGQAEAAPKQQDSKNESQTESKSEPNAKPVESQAVGEAKPEASKPETEAKETKPQEPEQAASPQVESPASSEEAKGEVATPTDATPSPSQESEPAVAAENSGDASAQQNAVSDETKPDVAKSEADSKAVESEASETPKKTAVKKKKKKKSKKKSAPDPYAEFENFSHPISKLPYHKTLAINRGEKSGRVKVKIQFDDSEFLAQACKALIKDDHPFSDFLNTCAKDAMTRLVIPSVEREIRRELTEASERHATLVFAKNLKNLLLQSPVQEHCVLAIDPGYKRGCSVAVVDRGGQLLEDGHIFVVGNDTRKSESKEKLAKLIEKHSVALIAIGNGAACRETEQLVSDLINAQLKDKKVQYAIINEAGASVYSTSEVGREELPDQSPAVRSAVSIGRRLIDPLSELVKISPANIGVGLYQHDIKAKHLAETLDDVVQFCVNRVGVDANTASPSLLRYVSGLNQLTARRLYEFRQEKGAFANRNQLKEVAGFGDATFVQSAGFLRVRDGDHPLDSTSVHPENYDVATKIISSAGGTVEELFPKAPEPAVEAASSVEPVETTTANPEDNTSELAKATDTTAPAPQAKDSVATNAPAPAPESEQATESNADQANSDKSEETAKPASEAGEVATAEVAAVEVKALNESAPEKPAAVAVPKSTHHTKRPRLTDQQKGRRRELVDGIRKLDFQKLSKELNIGELLLKDIINSICKPEFDPRRGLNRPVFRSGIIKIDDLKPELCLEAQVVNVVDFGVFVDIGLGTSCLVHVSQLATYFIRDPHRFFAVGDVLKVWVTEVDATKRRVTLTAIKPASLRQPKGNRGGRSNRSDKGGGRSNRSGGEKYGNKSGKFAKRKTTERRKPKRPKPVKPITDDMLKGSAPMTAFSDLAQFYDKRTGSDKGKDKS